MARQRLTTGDRQPMVYQTTDKQTSRQAERARLDLPICLSPRLLVSLVVDRRLSIIALACCLSLLLSGCLLMSGEQMSEDAQPAGGNFSTTFVSAEGGAERSIQTGAGPATLNVIAAVRVQQGELRLEMLDPNGAVTLAIQGRPDEQVTKIGKVPTDNEGNLHYRIIARGARNGSIEVLYQPVEP